VRLGDIPSQCIKEGVGKGGYMRFRESDVMVVREVSVQGSVCLALESVKDMNIKYAFSCLDVAEVSEGRDLGGEGEVGGLS
jgi:hypothetical protein